MHRKEVKHMHTNDQFIHPVFDRFFAMGGQGRGGHGHRGQGHGGPGRHGGGGPFPGGPWGFGGPRGRRARRGDVRAALLVLLVEEPRNGYQLMQEIEQRSEGVWRPSPGSVYPALQLLEDEGLVITVQADGGRVYQLTDAGRTAVEERGDAPAPWDAVKEDGGPAPRRLGHLIKEVAMASAQVIHTGDAEKMEKAEALLKETRRALYRILADDEEVDDTAPREV
jgi:DNA-binding PadR family transcriptional regulator